MLDQCAGGCGRARSPRLDARRGGTSIAVLAASGLMVSAAAPSFAPRCLRADERLPPAPRTSIEVAFASSRSAARSCIPVAPTRMSSGSALTAVPVPGHGASARCAAASACDQHFRRLQKLPYGRAATSNWRFALLLQRLLRSTRRRAYSRAVSIHMSKARVPNCWPGLPIAVAPAGRFHGSANYE